MHVSLGVTTSIEYFNKTSREIDWEEEDTTKIPVKQANDLQNILTCEVSIYLLRRATGTCGSLVDNMDRIRWEFVDKYEKTYNEKYQEYNDIW